jgi:1-deoxy-D-xylulose-5-phosphate synthase
VAVSDGPTVVRFPKGAVGPDVDAVDTVGSMEVLCRVQGVAPDNEPVDDVLVLAIGAMARTCVEVASLLGSHGLRVTVMDPCWVKPFDAELVDVAREHSLVAVVEDNGRVGAVGDAVARLLRDSGVGIPVRTFGVPQRFLDHAKREEILADAGLTPQDLAREIAHVAGRELTTSGNGRPMSEQASERKVVHAK